MRRPCTTTREQPLLAATRKSMCSNEGPSQTKINNNLKWINRTSIWSRNSISGDTSKELISVSQRDIFTLVLTPTKIWTKSPSVGEWRENMWHQHTLGYDSDSQKEFSFVRQHGCTWSSLCYVKWAIPETQILWDFTHMTNLKWNHRRREYKGGFQGLRGGINAVFVQWK